MKTFHGGNEHGMSDDIARFAIANMVPALETAPFGVVAATGLRSPSFVVQPGYKDVTRDPEDAIVHDHNLRVLLMRSGEKVPDDTLVCDRIEGMRALARAAAKADIVTKMRRAIVYDAPTEELMDNLATAFDFLVKGNEQELPALMERGRDSLRTNLSESVRLLRRTMKDAVLCVLVAAQHAIPADKRSLVRWDADGIDALLIDAGAGHARSVLHIDPDVSKAELRTALGGRQRDIERGLHFAAFTPEDINMNT